MNTKRGYALIIAIIVMSVMLSFGLSLGSLAYKQQTLSSGARESQYAFYAADAGLECALYTDEQLNGFSYADHYNNTPPQPIVCNNVASTQLQYIPDPSQTNQSITVVDRVTIGPNLCADVTVYKKPPVSGQITTSIYVQGYDASCAAVTTPGGTRIVNRGLISTY